MDVSLHEKGAKRSTCSLALFLRGVLFVLLVLLEPRTCSVCLFCVVLCLWLGSVFASVFFLASTQKLRICVIANGRVEKQRKWLCQVRISGSFYISSIEEGLLNITCET